MRAKKTEEETKNVSEDDKNVAILHEKMRRKRLRRLIGILVVLMIVLTVLNAGESVYFYTQNVKSERARIAEGAAKMTAAVIDPEKIDEYLLKGKEAPGYEQTESALYNIRDNSVGIQYLYVFQVKEDGCHVIFDLDADGDEAYEPGEVVRFEEQDLLTCKETEPIEMEDWIEWVITVYYPVYDQNGNFVCYVGADASLADVRSSMLAFLINVVLGFSVLFGIAAIITVKLSRNYYKISEWEALVEKERKDKQLIREMVMAFAKLVDKYVTQRMNWLNATDKLDVPLDVKNAIKVVLLTESQVKDFDIADLAQKVGDIHTAGLAKAIDQANAAIEENANRQAVYTEMQKLANTVAKAAIEYANGKKDKLDTDNKEGILSILIKMVVASHKGLAEGLQKFYESPDVKKDIISDRENYELKEHICDMFEPYATDPEINRSHIMESVRLATLFSNVFKSATDPNGMLANKAT